MAKKKYKEKKKHERQLFQLSCVSWRIPTAWKITR